MLLAIVSFRGKDIHVIGSCSLFQPFCVFVQGLGQPYCPNLIIFVIADKKTKLLPT